MTPPSLRLVILVFCIALIQFTSCDRTDNSPANGPFSLSASEADLEIDIRSEVQRVREIVEREQTSFQTEFLSASAERRIEMRKSQPDPSVHVAHLQNLIESRQHDDGIDAANAFIAIHSSDRQQAIDAEDTMFARFPESPEMVRIATRMSHAVANEITEQRFDLLFESPHAKVRAVSLLMKARYLSVLPHVLQNVEKNPALQKGDLHYLRNRKIGEAEIADLYREILTTYSDIEVQVWGKSIVAHAEEGLFASEFLSVGRTPPDIVANDLNGNELSLSSFRDKVVLLVFWGDWCPRSRTAYDHYRQLNDKFLKQPFAIVGVNSDHDVDSARNAAETNSFDWRSFQDGETGPAGPIAKKWDVSTWPTVFVLDPEGVIRYKGRGGPESDLILDQLVAETESPRLSSNFNDATGAKSSTKFVSKTDLPIRAQRIRGSNPGGPGFRPRRRHNRPRHFQHSPFYMPPLHLPPGLQWLRYF